MFIVVYDLVFAFFLDFVPDLFLEGSKIIFLSSDCSIILPVIEV